MTDILIVEDEPRLRIDLMDYLSLRGLIVEGVGSLRELEHRLATAAPPRVLLLDVGLPDGNGFEIAARLRATRDCGIIMLTAREDQEDRVTGFDSGADIYLGKSSTLREIEAAARSLLRRLDSQPSPAPARDDAYSGWHLDRAGWCLIAPNGAKVKLTATEQQFLCALFDLGGTVCRRDDLVELLARPNAQFDQRHLDSVVNRLRRKIERETTVEAPIRSVYGIGYALSAVTPEPGLPDSTITEPQD